MSEKQEHKKSKVPRDVELRGEIAGIERLMQEQLAGIHGGAQQERSQATIEVTSKVGANKREMDAGLIDPRMTRDRAKKAAERDRDAAIRKAHGDYERAIHAAEAAFDQERDRLSGIEREKNAPLEAELLTRQSAIADRLRQAAEAARQVAAEATAPLREELQVLEDAAKAKAKTIVVPDEATAPAAGG